MTIAGQHTVGELGDLPAALSFELDALTKASNAAAASWRAVATPAATSRSRSGPCPKFQAYVSEQRHRSDAVSHARGLDVWFLR